MPLYEFRCRCCGERFEHLVRGSVAKDEVICPNCRATGAERLFSAFATGTSAAACAPQAATGGA